MLQIPKAPFAPEETAHTLPMRLPSFSHLTQNCNLKSVSLLCLIYLVSTTLLKQPVLIQIQVASTQKLGTVYKVNPCLTTAAAFCL